jgi:hypothetical protein
MANNIDAKFYCLEEPAFFELIETVYKRLKGKEKGDRWITGDEVMRMLNISSPTSMQKLRDSAAIRFSQPSKKIIMYDRESVEEYLEKHSRKQDGVNR